MIEVKKFLFCFKLSTGGTIIGIFCFISSFCMMLLTITDIYYFAIEQKEQNATFKLFLMYGFLTVRLVLTIIVNYFSYLLIDGIYFVSDLFRLNLNFNFRCFRGNPKIFDLLLPSQRWRRFHSFLSFYQ